MTDAGDLERVRRVLAQRKAEIMRTYRAVGVGIGKRRPGDAYHVITVYLESRADLPPEPASIDGVPLKFEVTGPIQFHRR